MTDWDDDSDDFRGKRALDSDELAALSMLVSASGIIATVAGPDLGRLGGTSSLDWTGSLCPLVTDANELADSLVRVILGDRRAIAEVDQWRERVRRRITEVLLPEAARQAETRAPAAEPPPPLEVSIPKLIEDEAAQAALAKEWSEQGFVDAETKRRWHLNTEALVSDIALERHNLELTLAVVADDLVVQWRRVHPVEADAMLSGSVIDRLEDVMKYDERLSLELRACKWWYTTWGGSAKSHPLPTRPIRRLEWTVVDREAVGLGRSPVAELSDTPLFRCHGPRLQRGAAGLIGSHVSLFAVSDTYRGEWMFDDLCDGRQYRIEEESLLGLYEPGAIAVGRVIAYRDGRFLQSPGLLYFPVSDFGSVSARRDEFLRRAATLPRAVAAEVVIGEILGPPGERPIDVPAAKSPRRARRLLREMKRVVDAGAPPYGSDDPVMREWRTALRRAAS